jgi:hypothetical protein
VKLNGITLAAATKPGSAAGLLAGVLLLLGASDEFALMFGLFARSIAGLENVLVEAPYASNPSSIAAC